MDGEGAEFVGLTGGFEYLTSVGGGGESEEMFVGSRGETIAELERWC